MHLTSIILLPILLITTIEGARILVVSPMPNSHYKFCRKVILALAERGHDIVALIPMKDGKLPGNVKEIPIGIASLVDTLPNKTVSMDRAKDQNFMEYEIRFWQLMNRYTDYITHNLTAITDFIRDDHSSFDIVITEDFFVQALYGFAYKYKAPLVLISSFGSANYINEYTGNALEPSYVVHEFLDMFGELTFLERAKNLFYTIFDIVGRKTNLLEHQNAIAKRLFSDLAGMPHVAELERNASLIFLNAHYSMSVSQPYLNNIVQVGGLVLEDVKPLDDKFQNILDSAENGAILFSLGTILKLSDQPDDKIINILNALGKFKETVLIKWDSDKSLPVKHNNVLSFKWLPQNDILAHPKTIAFVTHGGLNSAQESVHHGIPIVCIPFFGDQHINCLKSQYLGYGLSLKYTEISEETLYEKLVQIVTDEKFRMAAKDLSKRFQDRLVSPKDLIIYWTEYVIRHKGADFMKGPKRHMYWYQILYLDLLAVVILCCFLIKKIVSLLVSVMIKLFSSDKRGYRKVKNS